MIFLPRFFDRTISSSVYYFSFLASVSVSIMFCWMSVCIIIFFRFFFVRQEFCHYVKATDYRSR